jgi:hypothetical protein
MIEALDVRPPGIGRGGLLFGMHDMISKMTELRVLARKHTRTAVATLLGLMTSEKVAPPYRISAANSLMDRGWGRPAQMLANEDGSALGLRITEIVNTIVDPRVNDGAPTLLGEARDAAQLDAPDETSDPAVAACDETPDAQ